MKINDIKPDVCKKKKLYKYNKIIYILIIFINSFNTNFAIFT